jgi:hypothetical protein
MNSEYVAGFVEFTGRLTKNGRVLVAFQIGKSAKS